MVSQLVMLMQQNADAAVGGRVKLNLSKVIYYLSKMIDYATELSKYTYLHRRLALDVGIFQKFFSYNSLRYEEK